MDKNMQILGMPASLFGFVAVGVIFLLSQTFQVIEPGFVGVSVTLGKVDPTFRTEGLTFKMPFIERIIPVSFRQQTVEGRADAFSSDLQTVKITFSTLYKLPPSKIVELYREYKGDPYQALLEPRIQDALKQTVAKYRAEDLVKNREAVKTQTLEIVRKTMRLKNPLAVEAEDLVNLPDTNTEKAVSLYNKTQLVNIVDLPIKNIDLTDELEQAIELKQIKEQEALAKEYDLKKARKDAEITIVNAEAEAKAVKIKGVALKSSPEVIELEIAKRWDGKTPSTVVVGKGGSNVLLPLR